MLLNAGIETRAAIQEAICSPHLTTQDVGPARLQRDKRALKMTSTRILPVAQFTPVLRHYNGPPRLD